ncbi:MULTISPECIES: SGNH/GDSL hydrolase family protein [unclassified Sinorhizobium]|uniref:SGNH/GDSL hydrolase family protein n=1 Tax=unclassified Sinorhizobium TaxID=2613772 RepID=UPI0035266B3E
MKPARSVISLIVVSFFLFGLWIVTVGLFWLGYFSPTSNTAPISSHASIRLSIIGLELPQIVDQSRSFDVMLGDSIVEAFFAKSACSPILNAGIGGGGIDTVFPVLEKLRQYKGRIDAVVLGIGVNDANAELVKGYADGRAAYLTNWAARYREAVLILRSLDVRLYILPILPVEAGKSLGAGYFDVDVINEMNKAIVQIGSEYNLPILALPASLQGSKQGIAKDGTTVDGVHPAAQTYRVVGDLVEGALGNTDCQPSRSPDR